MTDRSLEFHRDEEGIVYRIVPGQTARVGRHASNDWVVAHGSISRFHIRLEWGKDEPWPRVVDLNSANGTFVKGVRLPPHPPAGTLQPWRRASWPRRPARGP